MVSMFTENVLRTATMLLPRPSRRTQTHGWCVYENVRRELDEVWYRKEKACNMWREAKGTNAERGKRKKFVALRLGSYLERERLLPES